MKAGSEILRYLYKLRCKNCLASIYICKITPELFRVGFAWWHRHCWSDGDGIWQHTAEHLILNSIIYNDISLCKSENVFLHDASHESDLVDAEKHWQTNVCQCFHINEAIIVAWFWVKLASSHAVRWIAWLMQRRRWWQAAISCGEAHASFEPQIAECRIDVNSRITRRTQVRQGVCESERGELKHLSNPRKRNQLRCG